MAAVNQKEYLKKYLGIGKSSGTKKKRKKEKSQAKSRVKVIDDNEIPTTETMTEAELFDSQNEEAPQIVAVVDERPISMRVDEKTNSSLWIPIGSNNDEEEEITREKSASIGSFKLNLNTTKNSKTNANERSSSSKNYKDSSPPRRRETYPEKQDDDVSPPRKRKNDSSPRKYIKEEDESPPRRHQKGHENKRDEDSSPPRRSRKYDDDSPPRRKTEATFSNANRDSSPPRKPKRGSDLSPPRKTRKDEDYSPPRKNKRAASPRKAQNTDDFSPPRKTKKQDLSPRRKPKKENYLSPPRSSRDNEDRKVKKSRWGNSPTKEESNSQKMSKTLDGKTAGLQNARELIEESRKIKHQEDEHFKNMSADVSGRNATTVLRDRKTGKIRNLEEEAAAQAVVTKKQKENEEKYSKWGKGLKQVEDSNARISEELHEMSKPLARYADDEDLEKYLKDQERAGDPMLAYIRKKKHNVAVSQGKQVKPQFMGEFMPNRFGIRPGHRWDGVDRSNGYEKKWFDTQNAKRAAVEENYKWSTEDM